MPAISASSPGKIILLGEHAVVYARRAIAIPVSQVQARTVITPLVRQPAGYIQVQAVNLQLDAPLAELPADDPIRQAVELTLGALNVQRAPAMHIRIHSSIPIAAGLGSGAAVSVAVIRAVSTYLGKPLPVEDVSALAYEVEKTYHGTPSGIDNTVIAYHQPVLFQKGQPIQPFSPGGKFTFLIADTGISAATREQVSGVRERWQADPAAYESLFDRIDALSGQAFQSLQAGDTEMTGRWMTENHHLLQQMGVSCSQLDELVNAALEHGALGAKLSGAGGGGNMIALVSDEHARSVEDALRSHGARQVIQTGLE